MTATTVRTVTEAEHRRHLCPNADLGPDDITPGQVWENSTDQPNHVHRWSVRAVDRRRGRVTLRRGPDGTPRHRGRDVVDCEVSVGTLLADWTHLG